MIPAEIILIIAGVSLAILVILVGGNKFQKRYPSLEFLQREQGLTYKVKKRINRKTLLDGFINKAKDVGWNIQPYEAIALAIFGMIIGVGFGLFMNNEVLAISGLSLGYLLPKYVLIMMTEKRKSAISLQLESSMSTISSSFDVYGNMLDALKASIPLMESPIKDEFTRVVREIESGLSLEEALRGMENRVGRKELIMFNHVAVIAENAGGKAGPVLQKCAKIVAENRLLKSDLEGEVTQAKQDTRILFGLMLMSVLFFRISNSEIFSFYQQPHGKVFMLVILVIGILIVLRANKAARPKELD